MRKTRPLPPGHDTGNAAHARKRRPSKLRAVLGAVSLLLFFSFAAVLQAGAQLAATPGITTVVGTGSSCSARPCGDGGPATSATIGQPSGLALDAAGNLYLGSGTADPRIRRVDRSGIITTVAGNGTVCSSATAVCGDGGQATGANLNQPVGVVVDSQGNIYIADQGDNRVRKVTFATGVITTVAGTGATCSAATAACGDGGAATSAQLNGPQAVALDRAGNLYIADLNDNRVRQVSATTGAISTFAGTGAPCGSTTGGCNDGSPATQAAMSAPRALAFDPAGNLYVLEQTGRRIREVTRSTGLISTVAGTGAQCSSSTAACGDGGAATSANFNYPSGIAFDNAGNLYIADQNDRRVRKISAASGTVSTVAGDGNAATNGDGGPASLSELSSPAAIAISSAGELYVGVGTSFQVKKIVYGTFPSTSLGSASAVQNVLLETTATETITSIGVPASVGAKQEYTVGTISGCSLGSSTASATVCTIPITFRPAYPGSRPVPLQVVTSAGSNSFPLMGVGSGPQGALSPGVITTAAGTGAACASPTGTPACGDTGQATAATLNAPGATFTDSRGNVWVADTADNRVREFTVGGAITTVAGNGIACGTATGSCGDGGASTSANLNRPSAVFLDPAGNLFIADTGDNRVRVVAPGTGRITTVAGTGATCSAAAAACGDGAAAISAQFNSPTGLAMDGQGNLYIADSGDNRIRMVAADGLNITTVAGSGAACASASGACGDGASALLAMLNNPIGIFVDGGSNLYIADTGDNRIRRVAWPYGPAPGQGLIATVAGTGTACGSGSCGDGAPATAAQLNAPRGVALDAAANLFIADTGDSRVRRVGAASGLISTTAGNGTAGYSGDGAVAPNARLNLPQGLSLDSTGNPVIADTGNHRIRRVDFTATVLSFPTSIPVGTSDAADNPRTATLSNTGTAVLSLPPPSSGMNPSVAAYFALDNATTCPQLTAASPAGTLAPGMDCTYAVDFVPTQAGSVTGSITLTNNSLSAPGTVQTIQLSGTATAVNTTTTLSSSSAPSAYGTPITITATVAPVTGTELPVGSVQFSSNGGALGSAQVLNGSGAASFSIGSLSPGTYSIGAVYTSSNPGNINGSTASALSQVVNKAAVMITPAVSINPSIYGDAVSLTYTFAGRGGGTATPTGTAMLRDGGTQLTTLTLDGSGRAAYTSSALTAGSHSLTVTYNGDSNYY